MKSWKSFYLKPPRTLEIMISIKYHLTITKVCLMLWSCWKPSQINYLEHQCTYLKRQRIFLHAEGIIKMTLISYISHWLSNIDRHLFIRSLKYILEGPLYEIWLERSLEIKPEFQKRMEFLPELNSFGCIWNFPRHFYSIDIIIVFGINISFKRNCTVAIRSSAIVS